MTKISRYELDPDKKRLIYNFLWQALTLLEDKDQTIKFFRQFFTHTEREMFAKRLYIAKMLREDKTYSSIRAYLNVIDATITRTSNLMKEEDSELAKVVDYLIKLEKDRVEEVLKRPAIRPYQDSGTKIAKGVAKIISEKAKRARRRLSVED